MTSDPFTKTLLHRPPGDLAQEEREAIVVQALQEYQLAIDAGQPITRSALLDKYAQVRDELAPCLDGIDVLRCSVPELCSDPIGEGSPARAATLGDFRILREVGRGGMGVVYEAHQLSLGRRVALKALPFASILDQRMLQRFKIEAQAAAGLHHDHIVPVFGVGCERGIHYYAMQFIDGYTLADLLAPKVGDKEAAGRTPSASEAAAETVAAATEMSTQRSTSPQAFCRRMAELGIDAALATHYAHTQGILHRDIKPGNLMLDATGKIWITDFGLAQFKDHEGLTMTGELVGTLRYMSPEQVSSKKSLLDERTDVYSLGATLFELMVGRPLYDQESRGELLQQITNGTSAERTRGTTSLPVELRTILAKAVEKDPADRYQSAQELAEDLRCFVQHRPITARPPAMRMRVRKWVERNPQLAMILSLAVSVVAVVAVAAGLVSQSAYRREHAQRTIAQQALREVRQKNDALEKSQRQSAQSLTAASEAIDELYVRFSDVFLINHPGQETYITEFLQKALRVYESLLQAFPADYDLKMRAAESIAFQASALLVLSDNGLSEEEKAAQFRTSIARAVALAEESKRHLKLNAKRASSLIKIQVKNARAILEYGAPGNAAEAIAEAEESLKVLAECVEKEPEYENGLSDLANAQFDLAMLIDQHESSSVKSVRAKGYALQSAESAKRWLAQDPHDPHREFLYAKCFHGASEFDPSLRAKALHITEDNYRKHPNTSSRFLVIYALNSLEPDSPDDRAVELLGRALDLSKLNAAEHPSVSGYYQHNVQLNFRLTNRHLKLGNLPAAAECAIDGLTWAKQCLERFSTFENKASLVQCYHVYAAILCLMDDFAGAQRTINEAAATNLAWCEQAQGHAPASLEAHYVNTAKTLLFMAEANHDPASDVLLNGVRMLLEHAPSEETDVRSIQARFRRLAVRMRIRDGKWDEAAVESERFLESDPMASRIHWMRAAVLHAFAVSEGVGDIENYRRVCQAMIDRYGSSDDLAALESTIKSCSILDPAVTVDRDGIERIAAALETGSVDAEDSSWYQNVLALDAYRRGQLVAAQELANKGYVNASSDHQRMLAKSVSSLVLAAGDDPQQATLALNDAKAEMAKRIKRDADGSFSGDSLYRSGELDHDLLIAELLIREASAALGK